MYNILIVGEEASTFLVYHFVLNIIVRLSITTQRSIEPGVSSAIDEGIIGESSKAAAYDCTQPRTPYPVAVIVRPNFTTVAQKPETDARSRISRSIHRISGERPSQPKYWEAPAESLTHPVLTPIDAPIPIRTMNIAKAIVPFGGGRLPLSPRAKTTQMSTALAMASDKKAELLGSQG